MAFTNFIDSPFVTVGTANQALPSAANLSAALGVVVTDGSTITTTTTNINTTDYVLTANTSGVPAFKVNPAAALTSATVWTSANETATLPASIDIGALTAGLLKYTVSLGVATPARALPATTSVANDYISGSTAGASLASLSGTTGGGVVLATLSSGNTVLSTIASTTNGQVVKIVSGAAAFAFPAVRSIGSVAITAGANPTVTITDPNITTSTLVFPFVCGGTGTIAGETVLPMAVDAIGTGSATLKVYGNVNTGGFTVYYMVMA